MKKYTSQTPYIASYVILRKAGKIAFVLRGNTPWMNDHYSLPSGKVEKQESYTQAAVREIKEEAGVTVKPEDFRAVLAMQRHEPNNFAPEWVDMYFEADTWEGEPYNAEPKVHDELAWLDPDNLPDNTVPCVRVAIESIQSGKRYVEYGFTK